MELYFSTMYYTVVDVLLERQGFSDFSLDFDEEKKMFKVIFETDLRMRELRQWSAAAFACGLIESPRIERM